MFKENPDDFFLFIKKRSLEDEEILIRLLTSILSMGSNVKCQAEWLTPPRSYSYNDKIYLWIRKSAKEEVQGVFGSDLKLSIN